MTDVPKKIILVGDMGVGKTSLILNYTEGACDENVAATIQFDFKPKQITVGKKTHTLHIWDTAGQERFGTITSSTYRKARGVAYVYDVTREETFNNLKMWMEEVTRKYNEVQTTNTVIVGNKSDLPAKVPLDVVQKFASDHKATFIQTSAKTGEGIENIFITLAKGFDAEKSGGSSTDVGPTRLRTQTSNSTNSSQSSGVVKKKKACHIL